MPYVFPKRVLRAGDVIDPVELNEDFLPVVEVSDRLDAHNFKQGLSAATAAAGAFYRIHRKSLSVDPGFGTSPPFGLVSPNAQAFSLPNDGGWHAIPLNIAGEVSIDINLGAVSTWIDAQVQYAVPSAVFGPVNQAVPIQPFEGQYDISGRGARVQFALRVDGVVLPWTITGHEEVNYACPRGEKPAIAYRINQPGLPRASDPGPRVDTSAGLGCLGAPYGVVRLGDGLDLGSGLHRVDVVARRLTPLRGNFSDEDVVTIYSRKLTVITVPVEPRSVAADPQIAVTAFDTEKLIDQATMAASIGAARDKLNAVLPGMVARGGLRPEQLPSPWLGISRNTRAITTWTNFSAIFPGWGNETTISATPAGTGWFEVDSVNLWVSVTAVGVVNTPQRVRVVVDLHVQELTRTPESAYGDGAQDIVGMLGIGVTNGGTTTVIRDSIGFFNSNNQKFEIGSGPGDESRDHDNISLYADYEIPADGTYEFSVFGCLVPTMTNRSPYGPITTSMETKNGAITAILMRDA